MAGWTPPALAERARSAATSLVIGAQARAALLVARALGTPAAADRTPLDPSQAREVLVLRPDEIGDVVLTTPFLRALRTRLPSARITLVVKPAARPLVERCPYVDRLLTLDVDVPRASRPLSLPWRALRLARQLRAAGRPDLVVLPRWDADLHYATFAALWSGARWRLGFSERVNPYKRRVNRGFDRLLTHAIDDREVRHEVERARPLLAALGGEVADERTDLWIDDADRDAATRLLREAGVPTEPPLVALAPSGGHSPLKQWPAGKFAELARRARAEWPCQVLVVGAPGEEALGERIVRESGGAATSVVGRTTLRELAALLARCRALVSNDTGTMHIAAAAGAHVVGVFGGSNHRRFAPWAHHAVVSLDLPCSPAGARSWVNRCGYCIFDEPRCLTELPVASVAAALGDALAAAPAGPWPRAG